MTVGCCVVECQTDPQHHKPQAVGFVGTVAVSVSQERIAAPVNWDPPCPLARPWSSSRTMLGFLLQHSQTMPLEVQDLS